MKVEVLVSTIYNNGASGLVDAMNIKSKWLVVNQGQKSNKEILNKNGLIIYSASKGLGTSRNIALDHSTGDICVIADDDMIYAHDYEKTIQDAYRSAPEADLIIFSVLNDAGKLIGSKLKQGKLGIFQSMRVSSVQITFKRDAIVNNNITFNANFGAGSKNYMGEENIFLAECIRKGLKVYYFPQTIAKLLPSDSTWFKGYTDEYLSIKGKVFYNISHYLWPVFILSFALRKRAILKDNGSIPHNAIMMFKGAVQEQKHE